MACSEVGVSVTTIIINDLTIEIDQHDQWKEAGVGFYLWAVSR